MSGYMIYNIMFRLDRVVLGRRRGIYTASRRLIRQTHDPSIHRIRSLLPIILTLIQTTVIQVCCLFILIYRLISPKLHRTFFVYAAVFSLCRYRGIVNFVQVWWHL